MLNDLWPEDIQAEEVLSPADILGPQAEVLANKTNGILIGDIQRHEAEDRVILAFEVYAPTLESRVRLFEVHQRIDLDYPAAIIIPNKGLPDFLKKERYVPGPFEVLGMAIPKTGKWIENEWVATSPQEFSVKIRDALDHPSVKGRVLSLISRSQAAIKQKRTNGEKRSEGNEEREADETS